MTIPWLAISLIGAIGSFLVSAPLLNAVLYLSSEGNEPQEALAAPLPMGIDWHYKIKEKVGDAKSTSHIKIDEQYIDAENHCEPCVRIEYIPGPNGEAGLSYVLDKAFDFSDSKSLSFFAMGEEGGEKLKVKIGGKKLLDGTSTIDPNGRKSVIDTSRGANNSRNPISENMSLPGPFKNERFALTSEEVTLDKDWRKFSVDVTDADLNEVTHPFGIEMTKKGGKQVFFLKHIIYDTEPGIGSLAAAADPLALISEPLTVQIIANATNATASAAIEFTGNASGGSEPYSYNWSFGNGNEGVGSVVAETFTSEGTYNVTLTAQDSANQTGNASILIEVLEPVRPSSLSVELSANSTNGTAPATMELEANVVNGSEPYEFEWDFGDGVDEQGSEAIVSHTYEEAGVYNATVNVTDSEDQSASSWISVNITETEQEVSTEPPLVNDTNANDTAIPAEEGTEEETVQEVENTPPIAVILGDQFLAYPGDDVILDGSHSYDPEDNGEVEYEWTQSEGPSIAISGADTSTPTIEVPLDLEDDEEIILDLIVTDKNDTQSEKESVTIFVDYVESFENPPDGLEELELDPDGSEQSEWSTECSDVVDCLSDNQVDTFVSVVDSAEDEEKSEVFSFEDLTVEENQELTIEFLSIQVETTQSDATAYIRFILDDEEEFISDLVSTGTDNEHRIILEEDPRTGEEWTVESVNSLTSGFSYGGGQSGVRVSELSALIAYTVTQTESDQDEETPVEEEPVEEEPVEEEPVEEEPPTDVEDTENNEEEEEEQIEEELDGSSNQTSSD